MTTPADPSAHDITGQIVKLLARGRLIIDLGLDHGVRVGDVFAVFEAGDALTHPTTGEALGVIERVKAHLVVEHAQPKMSQLGEVAQPTTRDDGEVLSAVLARTTTARRDAGTDRRRRPDLGDGVRKLVR